MAYRVLVIEDDHALSDVLRMKLVREGHDVAIAPNQRDAYHLLDKRDFDFVLLDLRLPTHKEDMNPNSQVGFDVLDHIRDRFSLQELPVIVMTAYEESSQTAVRALKSLANDYITKPFEDSSVSMDEKLAGIARCIKSSRHASRQKNKHKIVFTKDCVTIDGITVDNERSALLLRILGRRTFMFSFDRATIDDPQMTGKEIAKDMSVTEATVRKYISRFKDWIASAYEEREMGPIDDDEIIRNHRDWNGYDLNFDTCYISRE